MERNYREDKVKVGTKSYPLVEQLSEQAARALAETVNQCRCVIDESVFRLYNIPLINAFFRCLMSILQSCGRQVIVMEETWHALNHLSGLPQSEETDLAKAGMYWFDTLRQANLLIIQQRFELEDDASYILPATAATFLRMSEAMLLNREHGEPFALITRNKELASDLATRLALSRTVRGGIERGILQSAKILYANKYGCVSTYVDKEPAGQTGAYVDYDFPAPQNGATTNMQNGSRPAPQNGATTNMQNGSRPAPQNGATTNMQNGSRPAPQNGSARTAVASRLTRIPDEQVPIKPAKEGDTVKCGNGSEIKLGRQLGDGAEAVVYSVEGRADLAAKVFRKISRRKIEKIQLLKGKKVFNAVLPIDVLLDADGTVMGYVMPFVDGVPVTKLFDDWYRENNMPMWDRRNSIELAATVVRTGAALATIGILPTDGNMENILVCKDPDGYYSGARAALIDLDSCQVNAYALGSADGGVIPGSGYSEEFLPPVDGMGTDTIFTVRDYAYILAIQAFEICMNGIHPFAARPDIWYEDRSLTQLSRQGMFPYGTAEIPATTATPYPVWERMFELMHPDAQKLFAEFFSLNSERRRQKRFPDFREMETVLDRYHRWINSRDTSPMAASLNTEELIAPEPVPVQPEPVPVQPGQRSQSFRGLTDKLMGLNLQVDQIMDKLLKKK